MTPQEAYKTLDLAKGLGMDRVEAQFLKLKTEMEEKIASTSNERLKQLYSNRLNDVEEAYAALLENQINPIEERKFVESKPIKTNKIPSSNAGNKIILGSIIGGIALIISIFILVYFKSSIPIETELDQEISEKVSDIPQISNPNFIQNREDFVFTSTPKWDNKQEERYRWYTNNYNKFINDGIEFKFHGWSVDGLKIAFSKITVSDCYEGFCSFGPQYHKIIDLTNDHPIENISTRLSYADGVGDFGWSASEFDQYQGKPIKEYLRSMKKNRILTAVDTTFYSGNEVLWDGKYTLSFDNDVLYVYTEDEYNRPVRKKVTRLIGYHPEIHEIKGYYKSPIHKRLAVIVKLHDETGSGYEIDYYIFGTVLKHSDFERF
jgi:hypothetical protein